MLFDILALLSTLTIILLLKRLVNIFPSLVACMLRWKESVNLDASVKQSMDRNMLAAAMIMPFCLVADRFNLYDPSFMEGMGPGMHLVVTTGVFLAYCLIRVITTSAVRPQKMNPKTYMTAGKVSFTFFIILTIILVATGGLLTFVNVDDAAIRSAMLWISIIIYALFLLRKTQIFASGCSIFAAFLYLCALEIIPTGVLVASALIF